MIDGLVYNGVVWNLGFIMTWELVFLYDIREDRNMSSRTNQGTGSPPHLPVEEQGHM